MGQVMSESVVSVFGQAEFERYWPMITAELDKVPHIWSPWWTKEFLWGQVVSGNVRLMGAGTQECLEVVAFTQITYYPASKILQCYMMIGQKVDKHLESLASAMEFLARENDCHWIEIIGRKGWSRKLRKFHPSYEMMQMGFKVNSTRVQ
jgi:hypothetical protein